MTSTVSTNSTVSTGNSTDVSNLSGSKYSLSTAEAVSTKIQPYLSRADSIATAITTNKTKISAYQSMQTLLQAMETATSRREPLRLPSETCGKPPMGPSGMATAPPADSAIIATPAPLGPYWS